MEKISTQNLIPTQAVNFIDIKIPQNKSKLLESAIPISICSYNILADCFVRPDSTQQEYLDFSYRCLLVVETIKKLDSDIVILQEVDHIKDFYASAFKKLGYEMLVKSRLSKPDSVAVLYKANKFVLLAQIGINFDKNHPFTQYNVYEKDNVGICVELEHRESKKKVIVLGTHLFWNPKVEQVRYLQTCMIVEFLERRYKSDEIIFWGGDLNSKPFDNNLRYVSARAEPHEECIEFDLSQILKSQKAIYKKYMQIKTDRIEFLNLYQKYCECIGKKGTFPKYTNYKEDFKSTLDHIFYNSRTVTPVKMLLIDEEGVEKYKSLPCKDYPSDHLPIMGVFLI